MIAGLISSIRFKCFDNISQLKKWINEIKDLSNSYFKSKKIAIDVINGPAVIALNKENIQVVDAKLILEQARVIKSPEELKCMKAAIEVPKLVLLKCVMN